MTLEAIMVGMLHRAASAAVAERRSNDWASLEALGRYAEQIGAIHCCGAPCALGCVRRGRKR